MTVSVRSALCRTATRSGRCCPGWRRQVGDIRLALGWLPAPLEGIEPDAFTEVATLMPGWGSRSLLQCATARFVPDPVDRRRRGPVRRTAPRCADHPSGRTERGPAFRHGGVLAARADRRRRPRAGRGGHQLSGSRRGPTIGSRRSWTSWGHSDDGPLQMPQKRPDPVHEALADNVLRFVPEGAQLQYGPGPLGTALLNRTTVPLRIDTGLLTDAVVDLDQRGMLIGTPSATYLLGTDKLYDWADGKHDPARHGVHARRGPAVARWTVRCHEHRDRDRRLRSDQCRRRG